MIRHSLFCHKNKQTTIERKFKSLFFVFKLKFYRDSQWGNQVVTSHSVFEEFFSSSPGGNIFASPSFYFEQTIFRPDVYRLALSGLRVHIKIITVFSLLLDYSEKKERSFTSTASLLANCNGNKNALKILKTRVITHSFAGKTTIKCLT